MVMKEPLTEIKVVHLLPVDGLPDQVRIGINLVVQQAPPSWRDNSIHRQTKAKMVRHAMQA